MSKRRWNRRKHNIVFASAPVRDSTDTPEWMEGDRALQKSKSGAADWGFIFFFFQCAVSKQGSVQISYLLLAS